MAFALLPRWTSALVAESSAPRAAAASTRPVAAVPRKSSLDFIMNGPHNDSNHHQEKTAGCTVRGAEATAVVVPVPPPTTTKRSKRQLKYSEKRQARACKVDGCQNYIINKGLCFRHGVRVPCLFMWVCLFGLTIDLHRAARSVPWTDACPAPSMPGSAGSTVRPSSRYLLPNASSHDL